MKSDTIKPATIDNLKALGLRAFSVTCATYPCRHQGRVTFDATGLSGDTLFPEIGRRKRFICSICGQRSTEIFPDWTDYRAQGRGRPSE